MGDGDTPLVADALARIKGMVAEMPGIEWTVADAARLSGLETSVCRAILDALRHAGFLTQRAAPICDGRETGRYILAAKTMSRM